MCWDIKQYPIIPELKSPYRFKRRNYNRLASTFFRKFLIRSFISFFLFNQILTFMVAKNLNLREGSIERRIYEKLPFPLTHKFYIFHVLNKDEVQNGAKPHLKEIGPFIFHEFIRKKNITDAMEQDTMEFDTWKRYEFRPDLSHGLTGNEIVTILHPVLNGIGLAVHFEYRQFLNVAIAAIKELFHEPTDVFWTGRAMDLLFDGIIIDCNTTVPLAKLTCNQIKKSGNPAIQPLPDKKLKFSILGGFHNISNGRWKVFRGIKNVVDVGRAIEVDGKTEMTVWDGDKCNEINGTDGLVFSPLRRINEPISIFIKQLCSSLHLHYNRRTTFRGIDLHVFTKEFEDFSAANMSCFCRRPNECPIKGTMDLLPCVEVPVTISLPHFLHADPSLLDNIASGIKPDEKEHEFYLAMDMPSGVPLIGAGRLQVNFEMEPVKEIEVMSKLPKMLFPWIWFEITVDIPEYLVNLLKYTLHLALMLNTLLKCLSVGYLLACIFCYILDLLKRFTDVDIFEEEKTFTKSPNSVTKIVPITIVDELAEKPNGKNEMLTIKKDFSVNDHNQNGFGRPSAVFLLTEIVTEAAKAHDKSKAQSDFKQFTQNT